MGSSVHPDEFIQRNIRAPDPSQDPWLHPSLATQMGVQQEPAEVDVSKLRESMAYSAKAFKPFLERFTEAVEAYGGNRYGENGLEKTAMNMLRLGVDVWSRQLVSQTPQCLVLTRSLELRTDAYELELAHNHLLDEIRFGDTITEVVRCGLFFMGIIKVGITDSYLEEGSDFRAAAGQPYAEVVLPEDFLFDSNARRIEEAEWVANRYRLPLQDVLDNPRYDPEVKRKLSHTYKSGPEEFADGEENRITDLSRGKAPTIEQTEYVDHVELWDVWLPSENLLVTLPAQEGLNPLEVRIWEGPATGPFHVLSFGKVPGNVMPAAPAQNLYEMQDLLTTLFNKLARQGQRQKTQLIADAQATEDGSAEAVMKGADGQVIPVNHVEGLKEIRWGGVDPGNFQFVIWMREMMSYLGGNIDAMGGLAQQAKTLGQERLLAEASSELIRDMQSALVFFVTKVMKDLAWYLYHDPYIQLPLSKRIDGYGDIPFLYGPEARQADFFEYNFQLQPYSLQAMGPSERLQRILQFATQMILPASPQFSAWGVQFNLKRFVELFGKYSNLPELVDLIDSLEPLQGEQTINVGQRALQSPSTNRNYTRENISTGGTQQARDNSLRQALSRQVQEPSVGIR